MDIFAMYLGYTIMGLFGVAAVVVGAIFFCDTCLGILVDKMKRVYNHVQLMYVMGLLMKKGRAQTKEELDL